MSLIERVARALAECEAREAGQGLIAMDPEAFERILPPVIDESWRKYVDMARAVLLAIREPSEGMVAAAWIARQADREGLPPGVVFNHAWMAMIDEGMTE